MHFCQFISYTVDFSNDQNAPCRQCIEIVISKPISKTISDKDGHGHGHVHGHGQV